MRRLLLGILPTLLGLWGCSGPDQELPSAYRQLEVPQTRLASAEAQQRGRELFVEHCALCHGEQADGRGIRRASLSSPPADFTNPNWQARQTPRRVYYVIREGIRGTSMASWKALSAEETWDLAAYIRSLASSEGGS